MPPSVKDLEQEFEEEAAKRKAFADASKDKLNTQMSWVPRLCIRGLLLGGMFFVLVFFVPSLISKRDAVPETAGILTHTHTPEAELLPPPKSHIDRSAEDLVEAALDDRSTENLAEAVLDDLTQRHCVGGGTGTVATSATGGRKNLILDLGANDGQSFHALMKRFVSTQELRLSTKVFLWEMNANFADLLPKQFQKYPGIEATLYTAAASDSDGTITAYIDTRPVAKNKHGVVYNQVGSSLFDRKNEKMKGGKKEFEWQATPREVCKMNVAKWLHSNVHPSDNVFMKIDIEGAEFEVLENLATPEVARLVDTLAIEWHGAKIRKDKCPDHEEARKAKRKCQSEVGLENRLRDLGIKVDDWTV